MQDRRAVIEPLAADVDELKGGVEDIIGTFPKADGTGPFRFGIRIAPRGDGSFDLITLLTKQ